MRVTYLLPENKFYESRAARVFFAVLADTCCRLPVVSGYSGDKNWRL